MTREDYIQRVGKLVDGNILAGNASFKCAKIIRLTSVEQSKTSKPIQGIFTILNEYEQASGVGNFIARLGDKIVIFNRWWIFLAATRSLCNYLSLVAPRFLQVAFQKSMKTASVHDLKSDLQNLFVNRYVGHGFKLPIILFSGRLLAVGGAFFTGCHNLICAHRWWWTRPLVFCVEHVKLCVSFDCCYCWNYWKCCHNFDLALSTSR